MQILEDRALTVTQTAKLTGFCTASIRKAIVEGRIKAFKLSPAKSAPYRILESELKKLFNGPEKS